MTGIPYYINLADFSLLISFFFFIVLSWYLESVYRSYDKVEVF